jgi:twitching motility protein PilT
VLVLGRNDVDLDQLITLMVEQQASDLHIRPQGPAYIRRDGDLVPVEGSAFTHEEIREIAFARMPPHAKAAFEERLQADYSFGSEGLGRFRVNLFLQQEHATLALRRLSARVPTLEELRLPAAPLRMLASQERGLILVTGITGSGKSSTLAAMIDHINETRRCHILTIEDPIEYVHTDKKAMVTQREIGTDTLSFLEGLRGALRQDPDVILVGEMRDLETTSAAMTAAETGHLVLGTLHTTDARQTINRIIDMYPPHQQGQVRVQLAETLKGVVSQRLLRAIQGGRVPAVEVLLVTVLVKQCIEKNQLHEITDAMAKGGYYGMQTFNQALVKLGKAGLAREEEILAAATNPDDVKLALRGIESGA